MDQARGGVGGSSLTFLSLVREVAADAAAQSDPDACLRHLRAGLIRLGFSRVGIWVTDRENPAILRGTWGTDWDGSEIDEHHLSELAVDFYGAPGILQGETVVTAHVARSEDRRLLPQFTKVSPGDQPNYAWVALRAEGHLIGIVSIELIPSDRILELQQIPALELLADLIAVVLARGQTADELNAANDELRAANVALRESEARYRAVSELASDFTYGVRVLEDGSMSIEWITDSAEPVTGFSSNLARDMAPVPFTIHPSDAAVVQKHFQSVQAEQTTATEFRILPPAGETRWLQLTSRPEMGGERGEVVRIYSAAKDITEQKLAATEVERVEARAEFLAEASRQFATAHDAWSTLQSLARLVVPSIADWCLVDLVSSSGTIQRFTLFHADEHRVEEARERDRRNPIDLQSSRISARVIRTDQSELIADGFDAFIDPEAYDERDLASLVEVPISSAMFVPLAAPGHAFGVITLLAAESGRHFSSRDLALVEELASRAAIAIDNVRLYEAERQARAAADRAHQEIAALYEATK
ncbi:MAG TPA: GAF domain-containing protein, partial [Chloroflexota bacterium]|nr:GAF domain-containing protein [Chloroflexota bacterium]